MLCDSRSPTWGSKSRTRTRAPSGGTGRRRPKPCSEPGQLAGPAEDGVENLLAEPGGERVLLARVVGAEHGPSVGEAGLDAVAEARARPKPRQPRQDRVGEAPPKAAHPPP